MAEPIVELNIDELRLNGFSNIDETALQQALQAELQQLLTNNDDLKKLCDLANTFAISSLCLTLAPTLSSERLGKQLAGELARVLTEVKDLPSK
ncbi:MAG: hypothetical protein K0S11_627 [Gammaproteobacteria bacterium]|jgi:hypothetical protein|nr:hypothetical protein [Gammaproteobacteria bacterium]